MTLVLVWSLALFQDVTKRTDIIVIPVVVGEPLFLNQRNLLFRNTILQTLLQTSFVLVKNKFLVILQVYLEPASVLRIITSVTVSLLLLPYLYHTASARVSRYEEVPVLLCRIAELVCIHRNACLICGMTVNLLQSLVIIWRLGKLAAKVTKRNVMYLSKHRAVPSSWVSHVGVYEEVVRLNVVCPAVKAVILPACVLAVNAKAGDKELLHRACQQSIHAVKLHVVLQNGAHGLAKLLLVSISCHTCRLLRLGTVHTYHVAHQSSDKIVLQRNISLALDILLLRHAFIVNLDDVVPLLAIAISLVSLAVPAVIIHIAVVQAGFHENVKTSSAVVGILCSSHTIYNAFVRCRGLRHDVTQTV